MRPRLLIFASGTKTGGGSGFQKLVEASRDGRLEANIVGVISNHEFGGVRERAKKLGVQFSHMTSFGEEDYREIVRYFRPDFIALSGWLKLTKGLDPRKTMNIHPGPLPKFGGKGMHGHHVHAAVHAAYLCQQITHTEVCMHFVTSEYDQGPVFFRATIPILLEDTPETIAMAVNAVEHKWQASITNMVVTGSIRLETDGAPNATMLFREERVTTTTIVHA